MKRVAVFNDTRPDGHYGCQIVMRQLIAGLRAAGMEPNWFWPVGRDWRPHAGRIPRRPDIDAIVVNGEGSIHDSATWPRARWLAELAEFAHQTLRVPAFLINATLFMNEPELYEQIRKYDAIFVRESASAAALAQHGVTARIVPDLTLATSPAGLHERSGVGATCSVDKIVAAAIARTGKLRGWSYHSIRYARPLDMKHLWRPKRLVRWAMCGLQGLDRAERFIDFLAGRSLVVTGRFHAVTLAVVTRTPFVAVESNTPKISAFVRDLLGETRRVVSLESLPALDTAQFDHWTPREADRLSQFHGAAQDAIGRMFAEISATIDVNAIQSAKANA